MQVFHVGGLVLAGNEQVVHIDEDEVQVSKCVVHHPLERLFCIFQTERHFNEFEEAEWRAEYSLGHIGQVDRHLVVPFSQVQLGEDTWAMQLGGQVSYVRN